MNNQEKKRWTVFDEFDVKNVHVNCKNGRIKCFWNFPEQRKWRDLYPKIGYRKVSRSEVESRVRKDQNHMFQPVTTWHKQASKLVTTHAQDNWNKRSSSRQNRHYDVNRDDDSINARGRDGASSSALKERVKEVLGDSGRDHRGRLVNLFRVFCHVNERHTGAEEQSLRI